MLIRIVSLFTVSLLLVACDSTPNHSFDGAMATETSPVINEQASSQGGSKPEENGLLAKLQADEKEAEQSQAATERETQSRTAYFEHNLTLAKTIGASVCTWQNSVGKVQEIDQGQIQVAVYGRAMSATNGIFFSSTEVAPELTKQEANVWTDGHDWAICDVKL